MRSLSDYFALGNRQGTPTPRINARIKLSERINYCSRKVIVAKMPKVNAAGDPYVRPYMVPCFEDDGLTNSSAKLPLKKPYISLRPLLRLHIIRSQERELVLRICCSISTANDWIWWMQTMLNISLWYDTPGIAINDSLWRRLDPRALRIKRKLNIWQRLQMITWHNK